MEMKMATTMPPADPRLEQPAEPLARGPWEFVGTSTLQTAPAVPMPRQIPKQLKLFRNFR